VFIRYIEVNEHIFSFQFDPASEHPQLNGSTIALPLQLSSILDKNRMSVSLCVCVFFSSLTPPKQLILMS